MTVKLHSQVHFAVSRPTTLVHHYNGLGSTTIQWPCKYNPRHNLLFPFKLQAPTLVILLGRPAMMELNRPELL